VETSLGSKGLLNLNLVGYFKYKFNDGFCLNDPVWLMFHEVPWGEASHLGFKISTIKDRLDFSNLFLVGGWR
jgi:hypothetical protein